MPKEFIFETDKKTNYKKITYITVSTLIGIFLFYSFLCYLFIIFSQKENVRSGEVFFKRAPDLLVVFTGDLGRIPFAIKKAKEYNQSNILISGVYTKNTVNTLLKKMNGPLNLDLNKLDIDYTAKNTIENVITTYRYLREKKSLKKVLIISHDYHMKRIQLIFNRLRTKIDDYEFYFTGVDTDYSKFRNIKILYKEVFKLMRAYIFLLFWDTEIISEDIN